MTVVLLDRGALDEIVDVLSDAFHDYPVMRHVLGGDTDDAARLSALIRLFASARALRGEPMFGLRDGGGALIAVATMTPPGSIAAPPEWTALRDQTWAVLGADARARYQQLVDAWTRSEPAGRHHHLNMIGVRRALHGGGCARPLLAHAIAIADADGSAQGLDLTTEHEANLSLYEHFGFRVAAETTVSPDLTTWALYRERQA